MLFWSQTKVFPIEIRKDNGTAKTCIDAGIETATLTSNRIKRSTHAAL